MTKIEKAQKRVFVRWGFSQILRPKNNKMQNDFSFIFYFHESLYDKNIYRLRKVWKKTAKITESFSKESKVLRIKNCDPEIIQ